MVRERIGRLAVESPLGGGALCSGRVEVELGLLGRDERLAAVVHQVGHHEFVNRRVEQQHLEVIVSMVSIASIVSAASYYLLFTTYY